MHLVLQGQVLGPLTHARTRSLASGVLGLWASASSVLYRMGQFNSIQFSLVQFKVQSNPNSMQCDASQVNSSHVKSSQFDSIQLNNSIQVKETSEHGFVCLVEGACQFYRTRFR